MKIEEDIILIAGPTASGKTGAAIEFAQANDGVIINTDSMQVYKELQIVSARPSVEEESQAPHYMFGHVAGNQAYSVAHWLEDVKPLLDQFLANKRKMIFAGGTGLYFNALVDGLSPMPEIDDAVRQKWRQVTDMPAEELYKQLDPLAAAELRPSDTQRIIRALEVFESTGRSIVEWQQEKGKSILSRGVSTRKFLLMPERSLLHERINMRFDQMIEVGALEEVNALLELKYPNNLPAMKAIGVPQLAAHLRGELSIEEAIEKAKAATRQYAKRQSTWFRNSFGEGWEGL